MSSKKQKGGAEKERQKKKIKLQIAAQSCHSILNLFKKPEDQTDQSSDQTNNENSVSVQFYNFNLHFYLMQKYLILI